MGLMERAKGATRAKPEPRIMVRMYSTPTTGADVAFTCWGQWRYLTRFPEEMGLADMVEMRNKRLGRFDGIPLEAS